MSTVTAEERVGEKWMAVAGLAVHIHHAVQKASELAELLTLLDREVRPRTVLEIGSDLGGSLYAWGALPSVERVYAVTLPAPMNYRLEPHGATVVYGDSHDPDTNRRLHEASDLLVYDFVYIDGDHTARGSRDDLVQYGIPSRSLTVLHDIVVHPRFPDCRVHETWNQFKSTIREGGPRVSEIVHEPRDWGGYGLIRW